MAKDTPKLTAAQRRALEIVAAIGDAGGRARLDDLDELPRTVHCALVRDGLLDSRMRREEYTLSITDAGRAALVEATDAKLSTFLRDPRFDKIREAQSR